MHIFKSLMFPASTSYERTLPIFAECQWDSYSTEIVLKQRWGCGQVSAEIHPILENSLITPMHNQNKMESPQNMMQRVRNSVTSKYCIKWGSLI